MQLKPGHNVSLLSKKSGATLEIRVENGSVVVRTQDIAATITPGTEGVHLQTDGEVLIGRFEKDE